MVIDLSRLGFGVSGVHGTPLLQRSATLSLIELAYAGGVRVFDTAPAYGAGEAEIRLGLAMRRIGRDRITLLTKAGVASAGLARRVRDFSPDAVERSLRASLARLGTNHVDGLILHGPAPDELTPALFARLNDLRSAGAYGALGVAGRGAELDAALATGRFGMLMAPVHPFIDDTERRRIGRARQAGVQVLAIETAGDSPSPLRVPRRPSDLYSVARGLRARLSRARGRGRVSYGEALATALQGPADCVFFTTSRPAHLHQALAHACESARSMDGLEAIR